MIALGESFLGQSEMKNLTLMFEGCGITDTGFVSLSEGINGLKSLKNIHFDFSCPEKMTDVFLESLAENMSSLSESLKALKLNLSSCESISDKGIEVLSESLMKLPLLENLLLILYADSQLADNFLISLGKSFKTLKNLKNVHFMLEGYRYISR